MAFKAQAPGSLMLLGEYAVLQGMPALVCALDKTMTVLLAPRDDKKIIIDSQNFGRYETTIKQLSITKPYHFVLGVLKHLQRKIKNGCELTISTDFSHDVGFGSSAAVTAATLAAMNSWLKLKMKPIDMVREGRKVIQAVQRRGSGADIAASVYGGIVAYQMKPLSIKKIPMMFPLSVLYSGYKTTTPVAIQTVKNNFTKHEKLHNTIMHAIGQCTRDGIVALRKKDWRDFGRIMNIQQGLMDALGVNPPDLQVLINQLREHDEILGAKISGSGLGDCVIGIGASITHKNLLAASISLQGVRCEEI